MQTKRDAVGGPVDCPVMQHTPGPWEQMPGGSMGSLAVWNRKRALVVATAGGSGAEEALANARLIAAAPELLAALIALYRDGQYAPAGDILRRIGAA